MVDLSVLVVQPDGPGRARTLAALAMCCDPVRLKGVARPEDVWALVAASGPAVRAPRLMLLDLPPESGLPFLGQLRAHPATAGVPVIAFAPASDRRLQEAWYRAGANSVVGHTADDAELQEKMRRLHNYWTTVNVANRLSRV